MARNDYTASDDDHLIEYIALENPSGRGRQGNNLYKALEENARKQWPWSVNHPWQSWRERYRKNQEWFDYHVKRYVKRHRKAAREMMSEPGHGEENGPRTDGRSDSKLKSKTTKALGNGAEEGQPKVEKVSEQKKPDSVVAQRGSEMVRKPPEAAVVPKEEPQVEKVSRKEKPKDTRSRHEEKVREDESRPGPGARASHTEEIPDSEAVSLEASQDGPDLSDDLMVELFGASDEDEGAAPPAKDLQESLQPKSPSKKAAVNDAPNPSLSSGPPVSQYPPPSSLSIKAQHPSQEPTPPKSTADHSSVKQARSPTPSPSYPAPTPAQRPLPSRSSPSSPAPPPKSKKPKPKPKKKEEKNIFESPPPTPSPGPDAVIPKRDLVTVVEGPFRTTLKRPRQARRDSDSDEGRRWPPKRSKTSSSTDAASKPIEVEDVAMKPPPPRQPPAQAQTIPKPAVVFQSSNQVSKQKAEKLQPQRPAQQVNAIASSSKVKLPDVPASDARSNSNHFISEQRQAGVEEQAPAPASRAEREPLGNDRIAGRKASIPVPDDQVQAVPAQSGVEAHDQITAVVTITNAKERRKVEQGKSRSITHTRPAENGPLPEGVTVNGLPKPNDAPIIAPIVVPVPLQAHTTNVPSAPIHDRPAAVPAIVPRAGGTSAHAHALPALPAHGNDPFISGDADATPKPNTLPTAVDKGKPRASDQHQERSERPFVFESKQPRKIDLHRQSLTKPKRPRASVSLDSSVNRPTSALSRRESLLSTHSRTSTTTTSSNSLLKSRLSKPRRSAATSRRSTISIADLERELEPEEVPRFAETAALEIAEMLKDLADTYGVSVKIALKTYVRNGTLQETERILQEFYRGLADVEKKVYMRMSGLIQGNEGHEEQGEDEDEEEIPEGLIPDTHRASLKQPREDSQTPQRKPHQSIKSASASVSPRRPRSSLLAIRPLAAEDDGPLLSDYSPPNSSRAGQFARLEKQGRREEALAREKRRASGIHVVLTQALSEVQDQKIQDCIEDVSPSPHDRRVAMASLQMELEEMEPLPVHSMYLRSDDDDMYAHTDDEFARQMVPTQDQDQDIVKVEHPSSLTKALQVPNVDEEMARNAIGSSPSHSISGEACSSKPIHDIINEIASANPKLAEKHRTLAFNVTQENKAKMRKFEAANDPKLLRYLSIKWVGEFLKDGPEAREAPELDA